MKGWLRSTLRVFASVAAVCAILAIEFRFHGLDSTTVDYSLLLAILFFAVRWDRLETIVASLVAALGFLYFFQPRSAASKRTDPQSYVEVAGFLITAMVVSQTAFNARKRAAEALERKRETERLYELGQAMLGERQPARPRPGSRPIKSSGSLGLLARRSFCAGQRRISSRGREQCDHRRRICAPWRRTALTAPIPTACCHCSDRHVARKWRAVSASPAWRSRKRFSIHRQSVVNGAAARARRREAERWRIRNWSSGISRWRSRSKFRNPCC